MTAKRGGIHIREKSGGGPPQSKTLARRTKRPVDAKRLGLRQLSGALDGDAGFGSTTGNGGNKVRQTPILSGHCLKVLRVQVNNLIGTNLKYETQM
jgi:hypothetical protein